MDDPMTFVRSHAVALLFAVVQSMTLAVHLLRYLVTMHKQIRDERYMIGQELLNNDDAPHNSRQ